MNNLYTRFQLIDNFLYSFSKHNSTKWQITATIRNASPTSVATCLTVPSALTLSAPPKNARDAAISSVPSASMIGKRKISTNSMIKFLPQTMHKRNPGNDQQGPHSYLRWIRHQMSHMPKIDKAMWYKQAWKRLQQNKMLEQHNMLRICWGSVRQILFREMQPHIKDSVLIKSYRATGGNVKQMYEILKKYQSH